MREPLTAGSDLAAHEGTMQWTCAKCGQTATANDWPLLVSMGWRTTPENEFRCSICAKKEPARVGEGELRASVGFVSKRRREIR
jgi:hypothetical protein